MKPNISLHLTAIPLRSIAAGELRRWAGKAGFATLSELHENLSAISSRIVKS
jgi:hypothetical protein